MPCFGCEAPGTYRVDNSQLNANILGVAYHVSKDINDRDKIYQGPDWGTTVQGYDEGDGWLKTELVFRQFVCPGCHGVFVVPT